MLIAGLDEQDLDLESYIELILSFKELKWREELSGVLWYLYSFDT